MKRKGSAIATALILGTIFFIAVSALLQHSSGEMKHVKSISAVKKAELLALSGIDWAESELRKGRWYGTDLVKYEENVGKHDSSGVKTLTPFGSGEGRVTIVCEDVANKNPGYDNYQYGMRKIWFLHHINVYAFGEYEKQKCLIYGRYIISPEPVLNSKSTEGAGYESPEYGTPGAIAVSIPTTNISGESVTEYTVKEIKVYEGDKVDVNTVLAIINPIGNPDKNIEVRPQTYGNVAELKMQEGQNCSADENLLILTKSIDTSDGGTASMKTLKKMVRVTKIPPEIWEGLDIENINDRFALSQYISGLSDSFLQNFVAHANLENSLKELGDGKLDKKISSSEVLTKFPANFTSTTRNRAENTFLAYMIKNFTAPGGTWEKKEKALNKTYLELDQPKTTQPPKEYMDWLNELGYPELINTKPRRDQRYFDPKMKNDEFIELLRPHLNLPPEKFIETLSQLSDAARNIDIQEGEFESSENKYDENENSIEIINSNKGIKISVEKLTKKYTFVDPESNFAIEMNDLLAFIKKYYDDEGSLPPREDVRVNEFVDWPLPLPPNLDDKPGDAPGGNWVWEIGDPGNPPGDPSYDHSGGSDVKINPPTGGTGRYEEYYPGDDPDGGKKDWSVPYTPDTDGSEDGGDPENKTDEKEDSSIKLCNCNGGNCSVCNGDANKEKITINKNTDWIVKPGTPGTLPEQGKWIWVPKQETDNGNNNGGTDGEEGDASGTSNSDDNASGGSSGNGGSSGSGTSTPGGNPGGGGSSNSSAPSHSYRSGSFGC